MAKLLFTLLMLPLSLLGQKTDSVWVNIFVGDTTNQPLFGAMVQVGAHKTATDFDGFAKVKLPVGKQQVIAAYIGHYNHIDTLNLENNTTVSIIMRQSVRLVSIVTCTGGTYRNKKLQGEEHLTISRKEHFVDGRQTEGESLIPILSLQTIPSIEGVMVEPELLVKVYPNPTNGQLTIQLSGLISNASFQLYNLLGQRLVETPLTIPENSIDISGFGKGIYLYHILGIEGSQTGKITLE